MLTLVGRFRWSVGVAAGVYRVRWEPTKSLPQVCPYSVLMRPLWAALIIRLCPEMDNPQLYRRTVSPSFIRLPRFCGSHKISAITYETIPSDPNYCDWRIDHPGARHHAHV